MKLSVVYSGWSRFYRVSIISTFSLLTLFQVLARADSQLDENIKKSINDPKALQSAVNTAKKSIVIINNPCSSAKFSLTNKVVIYKPLTFDETGTITGGAWKYVVQEEGCGATRILNVVATVVKPKVLSMAPLLPGTTHADPLLQKDAVSYAVIAAGGQASNCKTGYIEQTEFLKYEGTPLEGGKGAPWQELWTFTGCTQKARVTMHFIPDRTGTTISASLSAAITETSQRDLLIDKVESCYTQGTMFSYDSPALEILLVSPKSANPGVPKDTWLGIKKEIAPVLSKVMTERGGVLDTIFRKAIENMSDEELEELSQTLCSPIYAKLQTTMTNPSNQQQLIKAIFDNAFKFKTVINDVLMRNGLKAVH